MEGEKLKMAMRVAPAQIAPSPDVVCLVGLRNPDLIATTVMPLPAIIKQLAEAYVDELKNPQFEIITQETFTIGTQRTIGETHVAKDVAVLYYIDGYLPTRFSHKRVTAENSNVATEALDAFKSACAECREEVVIRPGDVLLVSNRYALHGRQEVGGEVGGETRWLLRTYGLVAGAARLDQFHSGSNFKLFP
jgi:L-asparagine oxygenase